MIINIDENYAVDVDTLGNYSLFCRKISQKGKNAGEEFRDYVGHFTSLSGAIKSYVHSRFYLENKDAEISLADAVSRLEAINNDAIARFGL